MNVSGLLPHQPAAVEQLLAALPKHGGALDGSDMGVGKTAHALAAIRELKLPSLVVGPAISETAWRRLGQLLDTSFSYVSYEAVRSGKTPYGQWENPAPKRLPKKYICTVCQCEVDFKNFTKCPHHYLGIHCVKTETASHKYGRFNWHPNIKFLVFDEVHRCGSDSGSLQANMLVAGKRQRIPTLGISATAAESPLDLRALGFVLGLHHYTDFYQWAARYGCRRTTWGGVQFLLGEDKKKSVMSGLHTEIFPERGARVRIVDLPDFPEVKITAELYDLREGDRVSRLYAEMDEHISAINDARASDGQRAVTDLLRAQQEVELLMVPVLEELVADRGNNHVAIFVNFRATVNALCKRLKTECRIDGGVSGKERQHWIDRYAEDKEPVIVCSLPAACASISLPDLRGEHPRVGFVLPSFDARMVRQVCGRLRRVTGKSKSWYRFLFVAGTPQEKVHKAVSLKLDCIDRLNDGDLWAGNNLPLTKCDISSIYLSNE